MLISKLTALFKVLIQITDALKFVANLRILCYLLLLLLAKEFLFCHLFSNVKYLFISKVTAKV